MQDQQSNPIEYAEQMMADITDAHIVVFMRLKVDTDRCADERQTDVRLQD